MKLTRNKVFVEVAGRSILDWSLSLLESLAGITEVVLVARAEDIPACESLKSRFGKLSRIVPGGDVRHRSEFAGLDTPETAEVTLLAKNLSGRNNHSKVAYGTEGGLFSEAGVPTVVIGPGSIDQAHKADEFIAVSELEKCGKFLDRLIEHCAR